VETLQIERAARVPLFLLSLALVNGCSTPPASVSTVPREAPPAGSRYNLSGYSESFKQGYGDACASPSRRNEGKYKADPDYQFGWNDGKALCKK
jgi:hypothetical protein